MDEFGSTRGIGWMEAGGGCCNDGRVRGRTWSCDVVSPFPGSTRPNLINLAHMVRLSLDWSTGTGTFFSSSLFVFFKACVHVGCVERENRLEKAAPSKRDQYLPDEFRVPQHYPRPQTTPDPALRSGADRNLGWVPRGVILIIAPRDLPHVNTPSYDPSQRGRDAY